MAHRNSAKVSCEEGSYLIWQRLSLEWQSCIEEVWAAYCGGSLPHGAVVVDAQGAIVARGRNRIREQTTEGRQLAGNRLAHAEMNALLEHGLAHRQCLRV